MMHFTERDWDELDESWSAWWEQDLQRPMLVFRPPEFELNEKVQAVDNWYNDGHTPMPTDTILRRYEQHLNTCNFPGDGWPRFWPDFGPGIIAGFLGAAVSCNTDTIWFGSEPYPDLSAIDIRFDADNIWWQRVQEITTAAVQRWDHRVQVAYTDLGGNLDILASLRGTQNLLMDMIDQPERVAELVAAITPIFLHTFNALEKIIAPAGNGRSPWAQLWAPGPTYMLQSDLSYMISPDMFARFVLPNLHACCEAISYPFYHLDGKGQIRHLDMLLSLEKLRGIQWIPGDGAPPPEKWLPLLQRIRDGGKLCQVYVTPSGAQTIVRELGGRGFAFCLTETLTLEEARAFRKELLGTAR